MYNNHTLLLQEGQEIIFIDKEGHLVKGKITAIRKGEGNSIIGCELATADDSLFYLPIEKGREIYREIEFSKIQIAMKIIFSDSENNLLQGEISKISRGEENKIIGCEAQTSKKKLFELLIGEDKVYALFSDKKQTPLQIEGVSESLYAGFWTRLISLLLDFIFLIPIIFLTLYLNGLWKYSYFITVLPNLAFGLWYNIYLPKKYGGTPGKLVAGMKIIRLDGEPIGWKEAIWRHSVLFGITILSCIMMMSCLIDADDETFRHLSWLKQSQYLMSFSPAFFSIYTSINNIWIYGELIVLLTNKRKRALHDFIAGTVIVKAKYLAKIREAMNPNVIVPDAVGNKEH